MSEVRDTPLRVGLTGGIASGKSTVAALFAARGATVIDADRVAHELVEPGRQPLDALVAALGSDILLPDGRLDRPALRSRIFADASLRHRVEAILHPAIAAEMDRLAAEAGGPYQVLVVPLLVEGHGRHRFDRVLVVDCPESLQAERLIQRDGETPEGARLALAAQAPRARRLAAADDVIVNDRGREALDPQVEELDRRYRALAARPRQAARP